MAAYFVYASAYLSFLYTSRPVGDLAFSSDSKADEIPFMKRDTFTSSQTSVTMTVSWRHIFWLRFLMKWSVTPLLHNTIALITLSVKVFFLFCFLFFCRICTPQPLPTLMKMLPSLHHKILSAQVKKQHTSKPVTLYKWWLSCVVQMVSNMLHCKL